MLKMLSYSSKEENKLIKMCSGDTVAMLSDDKLNFLDALSADAVKELVEKEDLIDLSAFDVTKEGSVELLAGIRKKYRDMNLMVIADQTISPMTYIRPEILASSLILRPFTSEQLKTSVKEMIVDYLGRMQSESNDNALLVDSYDGKIRIPYNSILYIEAREKKLFACLKNKEYSFSGTLDDYEEKLSGIFKRCHRSFLVNPVHIEKVFISKSEIILTDDVFVPLSRSYKPDFKSFS